MRGDVLAILLFSFLISINIITVCNFLGVNMKNDMWRYLLSFICLGLMISLFYVYIFKGRYQKVANRFKNESYRFKIIGWCLVFLYIIATFVLGDLTLKNSIFVTGQL